MICGSNLLAFGLYQVATKQGLNIPEEMALITFDRYPYGNGTNISDALRAL
ncbi:hypothetical protein [Intestinimonas sp. HCP28S3_D6]|uniref:hypothetical protein n=1 Tax=Intestinimonas sp. HCP28S3_D6 TaxID=3438942 RepID=UPI003F8B2222